MVVMSSRCMHLGLGVSGRVSLPRPRPWGSITSVELTHKSPPPPNSSIHFPFLPVVLAVGDGWTHFIISYWIMKLVRISKRRLREGR